MHTQPAVPSLALDDLAPPRRRPLVAVLPFAGVGDDESLRLLGAEAADLLRDALAQVPEIGAILISSDFLSRAPEHALELICRQLRVGYLVSGKCYRIGGGTSIYLELADTRHWHILWADFLRGNAQELLIPGSESLARVTTALQHSLSHRRSH